MLRVLACREVVSVSVDSAHQEEFRLISIELKPLLKVSVQWLDLTN